MYKLLAFFMTSAALLALLAINPLGAQESKAKTVLPKVVYKVEPQYTAEAKAAKVAGTVGLKANVDEQGNAQDIQVTRSLDRGLDEKAIEAVKQWRFVPGMVDGKISAVPVNIEVNFKLQ
jgi:protein TonB